MPLNKHVILKAMIREDVFSQGGIDASRIKWNPALERLQSAGYHYDRRNVHACWAHAIKPQLLLAQQIASQNGTVIPQGSTVAQVVCILMGWNHNEIIQDNGNQDGNDQDNGVRDDEDGQGDNGKNSQDDNKDDNQDGSGKDSEVARPHEDEDVTEAPVDEDFPVGRGKGAGKYPRKTPVISDKSWEDYADEFSKLGPEGVDRALRDAEARMAGAYAVMDDPDKYYGNKNKDEDEDED